ncbi:MAG: GDYXXLXY domain-containing protein [Pseudomonadota bacterium]
MMQTALRAVFLVALPFAGLAALWWQSEDLSQQGTDWEVEIEGYDPRDLLRGHYVEFQYAWPIRPAAEEEGDQDRLIRMRRAPQALCLIGEAPQIAEAIAYDSAFDPDFEMCEHKLIAQAGSVYGSRSLRQGRLYVGQERAKAIEEELLNPDQRGVVTIRQREDGVLTALDIRFRPLNEEELAQREAGLQEGVGVIDIDPSPDISGER